MLFLGRAIAGIGGLAFLIGIVSQMVLVGSFFAEKGKNGYFAYCRYIFSHPFGFFTYVFKELNPGDWRKRFVKPWLIGLGAGVALVAIGGTIVDRAMH